MATSDPEVREALSVERSHLCDLLEQFDASDWATPSLCDGWSVHAVVAHLSLSTRTSVVDIAKHMIRYRGNFDRMEAERARQRARDVTPNELCEQLRADIDSTNIAPGSSPIDALTDFVIHSQDIAIPLGVQHHISPAHTVMTLEHVRTSRWYGAKKRIGHATLHATDIDWTGGTGTTTIVGTALDLVLAASGRPARLNELSGSGVDRLHAAL